MTYQLADLIKNAQLTKLEKKIAEFFLDNQTNICFMTVSEVSHALNTSDTSIIRFARALGFSGYNDLQKHLQAQLNEIIANGTSATILSTLSDRFDSSIHTFKDDSIYKKSMELAVKNLTSCIEGNNTEKFEKMAELLIMSNEKVPTAPQLP